MNDTPNPPRPIDLPGAPGSNTGHGHVYPRPDGVRARCGSTRLCSLCQADAARKAAEEAARAGGMSREDLRAEANAIVAARPPLSDLGMRDAIIDLVERDRAARGGTS